MSYDAITGLSSFEIALPAIKRGEAWRRAAWVGAWVGIAADDAVYTREQCGTEVTIGDYLVLKTADNRLVPWAPSHDDILANDWEVAL